MTKGLLWDIQTLGTDLTKSVNAVFGPKARADRRVREQANIAFQEDFRKLEQSYTGLHAYETRLRDRVQGIWRNLPAAGAEPRDVEAIREACVQVLEETGGVKTARSNLLEDLKTLLCAHADTPDSRRPGLFWHAAQFREDVCKAQVMAADEESHFVKALYRSGVYLSDEPASGVKIMRPLKFRGLR